jgi:hypothetical protein
MGRRERLALTIGVISILTAALIGIGPVTAQSSSAKTKKVNLVAQAKVDMAQIDKMINQGRDALSEANKNNDPTTIRCVNQALTMMKGHKRQAQNHHEDLKDLAKIKPSGWYSNCSRKYQLIAIVRNKVENLFGSLKGCGGPSAGGITGKPLIQKEIDPNLPNVTPTEGLQTMSQNLGTVPSASPFFSNDTP